MTSSADDTVERSQAIFDALSRCYVSIDYLHVGYAGGPILDTPQWHTASAFVALVAGRWMLFTAGHVVRDFQQVTSQGAIIERWQINDGIAGSGHPPIPYQPDFNEWVWIDNKVVGIDIAFVPLPDLVALGLTAGKIRPLDEVWWLRGSPYSCDPWFVLGTPRETVETVRPGTVVARPTLIPVMPLTELPHSGIDDLAKLGEQVGERLVFGRLSDSVPPNVKPVSDIGGMSGRPVIGIRQPNDAEKLKLHIVGIQSGWFPDARVITVFPLGGVLEAIQGYLQKLTEGGRS